MNEVMAQVRVMDDRLSDKKKAVMTLSETTEMARSDAAVLQMQHDNLQAALTDCQARLNREAAEKAALAQKLADAQEAERQAQSKLAAVAQAKEAADKELAEVAAAKNSAEVWKCVHACMQCDVCVCILPPPMDGWMDGWIRRTADC